jgi:hypothetical protein
MNLRIGGGGGAAVPGVASALLLQQLSLRVATTWAVRVFGRPDRPNLVSSGERLRAPSNKQSSVHPSWWCVSSLLGGRGPISPMPVVFLQPLDEMGHVPQRCGVQKQPGAPYPTVQLQHVRRPPLDFPTGTGSRPVCILALASLERLKLSPSSSGLGFVMLKQKRNAELPRRLDVRNRSFQDANRLGAKTARSASSLIRGRAPRAQFRRRGKTSTWSPRGTKEPRRLGAGAAVVDDSRHQCRLGMRRLEPRGWAPLTSVNRSGDRTGSRKKVLACVFQVQTMTVFGGRVMLRMSGGSQAAMFEFTGIGVRKSPRPRVPRSLGPAFDCVVGRQEGTLQLEAPGFV